MTPATARPRSSGPLLWLLLALAWLLAAPPGAATQEPTRETQLPLDTLNSVWEVDTDLRRQLGLFPEVEGFQVARLFVTQTGGYVLEISLQRDGRLVRERRVLSPTELADLRGRIAVAMADRGMTRPAVRDGRAGLVLGQTALALGFYGWALPAVLDIDSTRGAVATYLLTAGTGFYLPYRITRSIPVTEAHRDAVFWGGTRGILYGALLGDALTLGDDDEATFEDHDEDERVIVGLGMAMSVAGSMLGYQAVDAADADRGNVALWSTIGDLSLAYGFGLSTAAGLYDGEMHCEGDFCVEDDVESTAVGHLGTLAVGAGGLWFAEWLADRESYTLGDARALRSFAVLGAQAALPLAWAAFEDSGDGHRPFAASLVAGSAATLWWGNRALRRTSLTGGEGLLVQAGHLAGGLIATGLTYLVVDDDGGDQELVYMSTSAAGSILGSLLTFGAVSAGSRPSGAAGPGGGDLRGSGGEVDSSGRTEGATSRRPPTVEVHLNGLWAPLVLDPDRRTRVPVLTIRH